MGKNRLIHDAAYAGVTVVTEQMEDTLRPQDRKGFHRQVIYDIIETTIEGYELCIQAFLILVSWIRPNGSIKEPATAS